jgi:hypothetical protein
LSGLRTSRRVYKFAFWNFRVCTFSEQEQRVLEFWSSGVMRILWKYPVITPGAAFGGE